MTDGRSKVEGAQILRDVGLNPVSGTIKFDRQEGGMESLEAFGFEANAVTGLSKAARFLLDNKRIGNQEIDALHAYHDSLRADGVVTTFNLEG